MLFDSCRGDSQVGEIYLQLSFSPLWTGIGYRFGDGVFIDVGEIHREERFYILSFSPLYAQGLPYFDRFLRVGEITQEVEFLTLSFSPYEPIFCLFYVPKFNPTFWPLLCAMIFVMTIGCGVVGIVAMPILYVYI